MTDALKQPDEPLQDLMDPAQCPFRDTCPNLMQCVTEFLVELARKDWGIEDEQTNGANHEDD